MATIGNDLDQAAARAAHQAAREARAEVTKQVDQLLSDVQALLDALREVADAEVASLRTRVESAVVATKAALVTPAQNALQRADQYAHARAWQTVGVAATSGLLVGFIVGGRSRA
jgi:ElaB/YqjD/DUF883 family membrane-anchored ribosome-binding protein